MRWRVGLYHLLLTAIIGGFAALTVFCGRVAIEMPPPMGQPYDASEGAQETHADETVQEAMRVVSPKTGDSFPNIFTFERKITMKENTIKLIVSAAIGGLCSYFTALLIPLIVMGLAMLIDYATGMAKAWYTSTLSSKVGLRGILKKLGYIVVVGVGMALDYLARGALQTVGVEIDVKYAIALVVIIWFILNELISILENMAAIGVNVPGFVLKLTKRLKVNVEEKAETELVEQVQEGEGKNA